MCLYVVISVWSLVVSGVPGVTANSYDLEDVCRRPLAASSVINTGITSPIRRFGLNFDLRPTQTIIAVLGLQNFATDDLDDDFFSDKSKMTSPSLTTISNFENDRHFDCMFGIKPQTNGNITLNFKWWGMRTDRNNSIQILQYPEKYVINVYEKGHFVLTARNYAPIQIRISVYENISGNYGLVVIASSQDDQTSLRTSSFFFSYVAPCFIILLVLSSIFFACFCLIRAFCFQCRPNTQSTISSDGNCNFRMCRRMRDKPPNYEDLFFVGLKHQQPPKYEECTLQTSVV